MREARLHSVLIFALKSDHFGIEISFTSSESLKREALKSDHFGIEMPESSAIVHWVRPLKSDHFGIEMW